MRITCYPDKSYPDTCIQTLVYRPLIPCTIIFLQLWTGKSQWHEFPKWLKTSVSRQLISRHLFPDTCFQTESRRLFPDTCFQQESRHLFPNTCFQQESRHLFPNTCFLEPYPDTCFPTLVSPQKSQTPVSQHLFPKTISRHLFPKNQIQTHVHWILPVHRILPGPEKKSVSKYFFLVVKVEKIWEDSLDSISSSPNWVKIQVIGGKVSLRY